MSTRTLRVSYGTSRGADTYGYTIVRLQDMQTGKRYRCMGGGYDMVGTVFAEWLQEQYQDELQAIKDQAFYFDGWERNEQGLYGMRRREDGTVSLDGACGVSSMERIAKAIGLSVRGEYTRRGGTVGFIVTDGAES